jgi:hypothetical protein
MQRKTRRIIGAVALIGALAAGGAAFTAGNPLADQTQSYSSANITGAQASNLSFTYSADGSYVTSATVTLHGNVGNELAGVAVPLNAGADAPYTIKAGFTGTGPYIGSPPAPVSGNPGDDLGSTCQTATYSSPNTIVTCDFTQSGPTDSGYLAGSGYLTQQTGQFNLLVTGTDTTGGTGS